MTHWLLTHGAAMLLGAGGPKLIGQLWPYIKLLFAKLFTKKTAKKKVKK